MLPSEHIQYWSCPVCGHDKGSPWYKVRDFSLVVCTACGMVYVNPRLKDDMLYNIYRKDYFIRKNYTFKDFGYGNYELTAHLRDKTFLRWYHEAEPHLKVKAGTALDVGCATGRFMKILSSKGWKVQGIELDEGMCKQLRSGNFKVYDTPLEFFQAAGKFTLITLFDVIEHIPQLHSSFTKLHELLADDGSLIIVTPNVTSFHRKLFGSRWFQFKPWEHISYFSPTTLRYLAEKFGFNLVYLSTSCGQYADLSFIHHRLLRYGFPNIAAMVNRMLNLPGLKGRSWYIPTGSILAVLQKK